MEPSEIRRRILDEHHQLREQLHELALLVEEVRAGKPPGPLRAALLDTTDTLLAHMKTEDEILAPALLETDAWGPWRVSQMKAHHERDRERVEGLRRALQDDVVDSDALVRAAVGLIAELHAEMADEDKTLLHPDILKDDLISIAFGG